MHKGFTLIELLVVIAIIAILAVVVVLTLNPAELLRQSRDGNRVSDMATLSSAINLYTTDQSGASGFSLGSSSVVYVSIPDPSATSTVGDQCQGLGLISLPATYTYHCAASSTYRNINGSGWIPVNLTNLSSGSPISNIPSDPVNTSSSRLYYTYTTNGSQFEITAPMESQKYQVGGSNDVISTDGGPLASVYEKGSQLGLEPLDYGDNSLVGLWTFDEGSGTTAYDYSGNNNNGTLTGGATWISGKVGRGALAFPVSSWVSISGVGVLPMTLSAWHQRNDTLEGGYRSMFAGASGNYYLFFLNGSDAAAMWISNPSAAAYGFGYTEPNDGQWHLYTVVINSASSQSLYVDGAFISTVNSGLNLTTYPVRFLGGAGGYSVGPMDDVRIYNRALTAAQILAMYNGGK